MPDRGTGKGKGKARAEPSERDPLLASSSSIEPTPSRSSPAHLPAGHGRRRLSRRTRSILSTIVIVLFSLTLSAILFFVLLLYSFKPSESELDALPRTAFAYSGPDSIQVLNVTDNGILVNVTLSCGIDADQALGVVDYDSPDEKNEAAQRGLRGTGAEWWEFLRRWTAHKALQQLPTQAVEVNIPGSIHVFPRHFDSPPLLSLVVQQPLLVPLVSNINRNEPWLRPVSFLALARPIASTGQIWEFIQHAWIEGEAKVVIGVDRVQVKLPEGVWWSKFGRGEKEDLVMSLEIPVPKLPGLPLPGRPLNLSNLVHLDSYSFRTGDYNALSLTANASLPNPINVTTTLPFGVPFSIALSDGSKMAEVVTSPIQISSSPKINITMSGEVIANLTENENPDGNTNTSASSPLSKFLQNYLHGIDNPIVVRGLQHIPDFAHVDLPPPHWLLSSLPSLSLSLNFPGPRPPPKIIQSVTIERMRISERAGKMSASGTVVAVVELPDGMKKVNVNVIQVLPNVLVYDGLAGDEEADPDNPPPRAFGHIQPDEFLSSTTEMSPDPEYPYRMIVRAPLVNVPLEVLAGRDSVLSDFVSKVVFKGGAQAGVKGTASVRVVIAGMEGRVRLDDLPVKGEFWVGRQR